ncbi:DUF6602 domain-containing protein [Parachlamydia sp.]|uniref:DUF6602 domain-containing protein n=1 Tax=Parachlamydia sp. TaxID=2052048 RepID=UPI003D0E8F34
MAKKIKKKITPDRQTIFNAAKDNLNALVKHHLFAHKIGNIRASGDFIESGFRSLLRQILPKRFYVTSGHIWNGDTQKISGQCDIIIADTNVVHSLMLAENTEVQFDVIPVEAVVGVFEVKSKLSFTQSDSQSIHKSLNHLDEIKKQAALDKTNQLRILPGGFVLGDLCGGFYTNPLLGILSADCSDGFNNPSKVSALAPLYDKAQIDIILSASGFLLAPTVSENKFRIDPAGNRFLQGSSTYEYLFTEKDNQFALATGIGLILDYLSRTAGRPIKNISNYFFPQENQNLFQTKKQIQSP